MPPTANYRLAGSEMYSTREFGPLQPLPGNFRFNDVTSGHLGSRDVISCHVTASYCSYSLVESEMHGIHEFLAFYSHFQVTSGQMTSLAGHLRSPEVT